MDSCNSSQSVKQFLRKKTTHIHKHSFIGLMFIRVKKLKSNGMKPNEE